MYPTTFLTTTFLVTLAAANPVPADVYVPTSDIEWTALHSNGLKACETQKEVNKSISEAEWQALRNAGLKPRDDGNDSYIVARDGTMNCGHRVLGEGGSNCYGKWIQVDQLAELANEFFAIYDIEYSGSWVVDYKTCYDAMMAPLGSYVLEHSYDEVRNRDNCHGKDNNDYEGGNYKISSIGAFGSEVYAALTFECCH